MLKGYEGMKAREQTIPQTTIAPIPDALDRLIELFVSTNKPDEEKKYRELRAQYPEKKPLANRRCPAPLKTVQSLRVSLKDCRIDGQHPRSSNPPLRVLDIFMP